MVSCKYFSTTLTPTFVLEIKENLNIPTKFKVYLLQAISLIWVYMACGRIAFG